MDSSRRVTCDSKSGSEPNIFTTTTTTTTTTALKFDGTHYPCPQAASTAREHGFQENDTRVHGPCLSPALVYPTRRPVVTGSVYRTVVANVCDSTRGVQSADGYLSRSRRSRALGAHSVSVPGATSHPHVRPPRWRRLGVSDLLPVRM